MAFAMSAAPEPSRPIRAPALAAPNVPASRSAAPTTPVTRSSGMWPRAATAGTMACLLASAGARSTPINARAGNKIQMESRPAQ